MLRAFKSQYLNISAVTLVIVLLIWLFKQTNGHFSPFAWQLLLAIAVVVSAGVFNFWRLLKLKETPISTIAAAAQGYVELYGQASASPPMRTPYQNIPCVWYKAWVFANFSDLNSGNLWFNHRLLDYQQSMLPFVLTDESGQCTVNPQGAEVKYFQTRTWRKNEHRYVEQYLPVNQPLYVVGHLDTRHDKLSEKALNEALKTELTHLKTKRWYLLNRYDHNRNGELDMEEWVQVREDVTMQIQSQHAMQSHTQDYTIAKPAGKQLFLISAKSPQQLRQRYQYWLLLHLILLMGLLSLCIQFN